MKPVLLDTGVIVAALDRDERNHARCVHSLHEINAPLLTCEAVIAESCHLVRKLHGAAESILANVANGNFGISFDLSFHAKRVRQLMAKYAKVPMDFADACLVCMAEEFETSHILTLDKDFAFYRWNRTKKFKNLLDN